MNPQTEQNSLRILEIITPSRIGGAEVYVTGFYKAAREMGAQVTLFCPQGRPFIEYARERGIGAVTWKTHGKIDPYTVFQLARLIRCERADVVHTHLSTASLLGAIAAKMAGVPSVAHVHGLNSATCFQYSTAIIAVSDAVKSHLCLQGIKPEKIHVVHNGVDLSHFSGNPFPHTPHAPTFGVFGRLSPEKGQRVAIEALFLVTREHPNARLMIVGDGKDRDDLIISAKALGIEANVEFAGFQPDIREFMARCDAVIVPSVREGFGLAAVEAMAMGKPVVASAVGGLPEIVVENKTGFLIPPSNPQALSDALLRLISNPALARRLGASGRRRVEECFDAKKQMVKVMDVLREVSKT